MCTQPRARKRASKHLISLGHPSPESKELIASGGDEARTTKRNYQMSVIISLPPSLTPSLLRSFPPYLPPSLLPANPSTLFHASKKLIGDGRPTTRAAAGAGAGAAAAAAAAATVVQRESTAKSTTTTLRGEEARPRARKASTKNELVSWPGYQSLSRPSLLSPHALALARARARSRCGRRRRRRGRGRPSTSSSSSAAEVAAEAREEVFVVWPARARGQAAPPVTRGSYFTAVFLLPARWRRHIGYKNLPIAPTRPMAARSAERKHGSQCASRIIFLWAGSTTIVVSNGHFPFHLLFIALYPDLAIIFPLRTPPSRLPGPRPYFFLLLLLPFLPSRYFTLSRRELGLLFTPYLVNRPRLGLPSRPPCWPGTGCEPDANRVTGSIGARNGQRGEAGIEPLPERTFWGRDDSAIRPPFFGVLSLSLSVCPLSLSSEILSCWVIFRGRGIGVWSSVAVADAFSVARTVFVSFWFVLRWWTYCCSVRCGLRIGWPENANSAHVLRDMRDAGHAVSW